MLYFNILKTRIVCPIVNTFPRSISYTINSFNLVLTAAELSTDGSLSSSQYISKASTKPDYSKTRESGEAYKGYLNIFINPVFVNETYEANNYWHKYIFLTSSCVAIKMNYRNFLSSYLFMPKKKQANFHLLIGIYLPNHLPTPHIHILA